MNARGGRVFIADFSSGNPPAQVRYVETWGQSPLLDGWHDVGDLQLVGDFMGLGRDQVLFINNSGDGGRVFIADFSSGNPPAQVKYVEIWGQSTLLNGWHDPEDIQLVGDFMKLGHDQVLFINRGGGTGRVTIVDFSGGNPPAQVRYFEAQGQDPLLNGWYDFGVQRVGDFVELGRDQVLFVNQFPRIGGHVLIADFSSGHPPAQVRYLETWAQQFFQDSPYHLHLAGDFMGLQRDRMLSINPFQGVQHRVRIVDFSSGAPPPQLTYVETWGLLDGWYDFRDLQLVGDFMGLGRDQVLFINNSGDGGRVFIADFSSGNPPAQVKYVETWGQSPLLDGWHDREDLLLAGDFMG